MRDVRSSLRAAAAVLVLAAAASVLGLAAGCAPGAGPRPIARGASCDACGMSITDLAFACERNVGREWRVYDSIECLLRERGDGVYLADYDTKTLHAADSMWVVRGAFPSPMGGGYAAFLERGSADDVAARTSGRVGRLAAFAGAAP
jgi:nitrous oxide reductase accessory protein NosL